MSRITPPPVIELSPHVWLHPSTVMGLWACPCPRRCRSTIVLVYGRGLLQVDETVDRVEELLGLRPPTPDRIDI